MAWLGTIAGGLVGMVVGGPIGAVVGALIGRGVDTGVLGPKLLESTTPEQNRITQQRFFTASFLMLGQIAKSDGRVSEAEIEFARYVMGRMSLDDTGRRAAMELFNHGKSSEFDADAALIDFAESDPQRMLIHMFLELMINMAYVDGQPTAEKRHLFDLIQMRLRIPGHVFNNFERLIQLQRRINDAASQANAGSWSSYRPGSSSVQPRRNSLSSAYATLGLSADASMDEVKKAYRKLMSRNHPDKLIAKGLPEEAIKLAGIKTQEIRAAYETIVEARGK